MNLRNLIFAAAFSLVGSVAYAQDINNPGVQGPASATNGNVAVFSGTTGKIIANGAAPSTTVNGQTCTLGSSCTISTGGGAQFAARNASNQSISTSTFTKVTLGTEIYDTDSSFSGSTFTVPTTGYYLFQSQIIGTGTAVTVIASAYYVNGAAGDNYQWDTRSATSGDHTLTSARVLALTAGDTVELYGRLDATSPSFEGSGGFYCTFSAQYLHN